MRFGEISPRTIVLNILKSKKLSASVLTYLSEIGWREFSYSLLYYSKNLASVPINMKFQKFPWRKSSKDLELWKKGKTGIPLVDAAMKQIYEKGWMHNRLRMVVGSFLVKNLLLNWTLGERYFQETLLDYDEASNALVGNGLQDVELMHLLIFVCSTRSCSQSDLTLKQNLFCSIYPNYKLYKNLLNFQPHLQEQAFQSLINQSLYYEPLVDLKDSRNRALEAYQKIK